MCRRRQLSGAIGGPMRRTALLFCFCLFALPACTLAQTGLPAFGSFESTGFDAVNRQNLNGSFVIPIFSIPGRGQSFQYSLVNNSLLWTTTATSPITWTSVTDDSGNPAWGWNFGPAVAGAGRVLVQVSSHLCRYIDPDTGLRAFASWTLYSNYRYKDWRGTVHPFSGAAVVASDAAQTNCGISSSDFSGYATDNTGFFIQTTGGEGQVLSPAGVNAGAAPVDTNGNYISQTVVSST